MPDKIALVTAAGSGLGAGIARELAAQGWKVAVSSSSGKGEALGKSLGGLGFTASNDDPAALERVVKGTLDAYGRIDALVNSSAHPPKGDLLAISDDDWHRGLDIVMLSVIRLSRLVTPVMEKQGGGTIVNVSTFAAFEPDLAFPVSCALRAALGSFAKLYSDRYAKANIRMNNVLPGFFDSLPEKEAARQRVPLGRYGKVEELAKTVAFLVSDGAGYIAGQNLRVDGGITRGV
ncbi:MAG: SDR family oxidoreductase [Alphaproteobacteria bacterium]|nr:SDR family oxidoreductase [Alphaproteobacteria bacterium]